MRKGLKGFWLASMLALAAAMLYLAATGNPGAGASAAGGYLFPVVMALAFFAEYIDSSIGMGYGTSLTPLLLLAGFAPGDIVPAILFSECFSGIAAGLLHHRLGNTDLRSNHRTRGTLALLSICSVAGVLLAAAAFVSLPKVWIKAYIGLMIVGVSLFLLRGGSGPSAFRWRKILGLGTLAAFNKGISGGGYGPLMTGGQILSGIPEKDAVAVTSLAEGATCFVGAILFAAIQGRFFTPLTLPLALGAALSVPMAAWTVKVLPPSWMRRSIGYATLFLGVLTLVHTLR